MHTTTAVRFVALLTAASLVVWGCGDDEDGADPSSTTEAGGPEADVELRDDALRATTVADDLEQPTAIAFAGEAGMLVTEKASGRVLRIVDGEPEEVLDLAVNAFDERGLLGIAVHPDFPTEPFVYLHWTGQTDSDDPAALLGEDSTEATEVPALGNRVDRFRWEDEELTFDRNLVRFPSNTLDTDTSGKVRATTMPARWPSDPTTTST